MEPLENTQFASDPKACRATLGRAPYGDLSLCCLAADAPNEGGKARFLPTQCVLSLQPPLVPVRPGEPCPECHVRQPVQDESSGLATKL